jgi:hypothetical protein
MSRRCPPIRRTKPFDGLRAMLTLPANQRAAQRKGRGGRRRANEMARRRGLGMQTALPSRSGAFQKWAGLNKDLSFPVNTRPTVFGDVHATNGNDTNGLVEYSFSTSGILYAGQIAQLEVSSRLDGGANHNHFPLASTANGSWSLKLPVDPPPPPEPNTGAVCCWRSCCACDMRASLADWG